MARILGLCAGAGLLAVVPLYLAWLNLSGNVHEVSPDTVYRAAQMDGQTLARWTRRLGIAGVLTLRGAADGADWYESERAVSDRLGIEASMGFPPD